MKRYSVRTIPHRRKREGKTDYKLRFSFLKSGEPRLTVRISLKNITAQLIAYEPTGDKVLASASTKELEKMGWTASRKNLPCAYTLGKLIAKKAIQQKIKTAILDIGMQSRMPGGKLYAVLKGAIDGGLKIPHSPETFPDAKRLAGEHLPPEQKTKTQQSLKKVVV